ncbi:MAG: allophanate hydrolase subunit 1, partial [Actinomycetota bacterium]|nr:allophanate hydrolase subunit 1 [Actinomycetota bacterium]
VLVLVARPADLPGVVERLRSLDLDPIPERDPADEPLRIEVTYNGPDLLDVADHLGVTDTEVVRRHTSQVWTVEFTGFAAGFGYLTGAENGLDVPRRADPRTRIPAGSVGLAGPYSGVYPRDSPGGWQIIGRTADPMWDPTRDPPALLTPGREVRFVQVER